jgi:hypothetical protein
MTTTKLAKLYEHLTPRERLPMLVAACRRGDETERQRLIETAPRRGFRLPDYHGLADALQSAVLLHMIERLDLGARFWLTLCVLEMQDAADTPKARARSDHFEVAVATMALRFCIEVDGWKLFCAGLDLDPDALLADLPAFRTVVEMERQARAFANTTEEADAYLRKKTSSESARLPTVEEVAESFGELLAVAQGPWR